MESYVVIGGGLAGLTAANALAMQSGKVTLLEQSAHLGGRARTHRENGYSLNLGPHALYRGGHAARTFKDWNIRYSGGLPATSSSGYFVRAERLYPMFRNLSGLLTTRMFNLREKLEVANLLRLFAAADAKHPDPKHPESMSRWLDRHTSLPRVREFAATLIRVSTFAIDLDHLSAAFALTQLASALKRSVLYLDGGWQTLVDGLAERARSLGVEIRCGEPVTSLESIDATGIVLAAGPETIGKLTGAPLPVGRPVRMAALDLSLSGMHPGTPAVAFATGRCTSPTIPPPRGLPRKAKS
jgi:phytoene dehydrogenase-like protein